MKIWLAPSAYFPHKGGVEELTFQLARELGGRGHDVLVVAPRHPVSLPRDEVLDGVQVARVNFRAPRRTVLSLARYSFDLAAQLGSLLRAWRTLRPDVVHVQCPSVQLPVLTLLCMLRRVPLVLTSQGEVKMDANGLYDKSAFMRASLRWASKRAAALTACSSWTATAAASVASRFTSATVVLNGVDPAQWQVTPPAEEPIVCAWGRHVPQKGLDLLIEAFVDVRALVPDAQLVIGGDGPESPRLRAMAGPGVRFVGALDRDGVQALLAQSRIAVVPSRLEPFGIVALEAMAAGREVVWSTVGGLKDATQGYGWGVDPADREALAAAVLTALSSPSRPAEVRAAAEKLSWAGVTEQYVDIYRLVLEQYPR